MSLTNSINTLLSNHQKKVSSLNGEEQSSLNDIRTNIKLGLLEEVVSSIRDYVTSHNEVASNVSPGTIGSFLLGCIGNTTEENVCSSFSNEKEDEKENVFVVDDENGMSAVFVSPSSTKASIYFTGEDSFLSQEEKEKVLSFGIKRIKYYTLSNNSFVLRNTEDEIGGESVSLPDSILEMKIPLFVVIVIIFVLCFIYYEKFLH